MLQKERGTTMKITSEEFDNALMEVIDKDKPTASQLLSISGIYEILSEYYNDEVLDWIKRLREEKNDEH